LKIVVVSSVGGHLTEVMQLAPLLVAHDVVLVVNDAVELPAFPFRRVYRISHAERDWRTVLNVAEASRILVHERPDLIVSAGAGPAVPFAAVGRWFLGCRVVYIESAAAIHRPTLTGRLMYRIAHDFFYQWPDLQRFFPTGQLAPVVFG
jgi:UDP-N-acetylglucosamine:LPS N-acetylglucosamine transferase